MISPKDVRIGNLVSRRYNGDYSTYAIRAVDLLCLEDKESNAGDTYMPIPLNTDILYRCGFIMKDQYYYDGKISLAIHPHVQYLHQLQNLYYSLIGQELEYKENS